MRWILAATLTVVPSVALAHIELVSPAPRTTSQKTGPCGVANSTRGPNVTTYAPGATVTITPSLPSEHGPIYFNANVIPQADLTETSDDGGVLYTNVPPGTYVLSASKDGVTFEDVTIQCEPDVLVNPSPPHGLQALP